jgi:hypothetical protein
MKKLKEQTPSRLLIYLLIISIILFLFSSKGLRSAFFIVFFAAANVFATLYKRYFYLPVEFEILSLGIVLCSYTYGLTAGLAVAIIGGLAYTVFCTNFSPFTFPMLLGYCLMAVIGTFVPVQNIILLGIIANVAHNMFVFTIYHVFFSYNIFKNLVFSISNIIFNALLFWNLGPLILRIMG